MGARFAGHNVVWIIGGDQLYDTDVKRAYWDAFARQLRTSSGGSHLMTAHPGGYSGSFHAWPIAPEWLDFHMYQASHIADIRYILDDQGQRTEDQYGSLHADGGYHWAGALQGYHLSSTAPILNTEGNYEDMISRFWEWIGREGGMRIRDIDVRHSAYWGLLSGSLVGYGYGADGVWPWSNTLDPEGFRTRHTVMEAIDLPGAFQMGHVRSFAEAHEWFTWKPRPDLVHEIDTDHFVPASTWGDAMIVYAPEGSRRFRVQMPDSSTTSFDLMWTHPVTGAVVPDTVVGDGGAVVLSPPDEADWLLVVRPLNELPTQPTPAPSLLEIRPAGANPTRSAPAVVLTGAVHGAVRVRLLDLLGREVFVSTVTMAGAPVSLSFPTVPAGTYVCHATYTDAGGDKRSASHTLTVVR